MKKLFLNFYVSFVSFIAGMLFIIQCGGGASSVAQNVVENVASALGISYDNSNSNLEAENVQEALDEVGKSLPMVIDAEGKKIGIFLSSNNSIDWQIWDIQKKQIFNVSPGNGEILDPQAFFFFESNDCTGDPYLATGQPHQLNNGNWFQAKIDGKQINSSQINSSIIWGRCESGFAFSNPYTLFEAEIIQVPQYKVPLYLK